LAVANYCDVQGHFPPAYVADENGRPLLSWRVLVLPYLDQKALFDQFDLTEPWDGPTNSRLLSQMPNTYRLHTIDDDNKTATNYVAVVGEKTMWSGAEGRPNGFSTDGSLNTLLVAEFVGRPIPWTKPEDLLFDEMDMTVDSDNGICSVLTPPAFLDAGGFVHYLPADTDQDTVRAWLTAQGGEPIGDLPRSSDGRLRPRKSL
jgi:hypothetical protein